jgi:anaerobic dimethyl sulfoxide reductase subunit B (iron-sulfur subunit)
MTTPYAFYFDATFCSGCKACQAACKDKNNLPLGVLWRRVYEVSGGTWQKNGEAWNNTVFAYNLSISCNHCVHPKCAGVCPVDAYVVREDGIVFLDSTKCVGCGYCAWACPYGAPQYNADAGRMTKCDFCIDHLEQGLPPACVAACPLRVLDYGETRTESILTSNQHKLWESPAETHPYPLPNYSHTQPRLALQPHAAMNTLEKKSVANLEEIQPRSPSVWEETPLMLFTLLGQMAVGGFWAMLWLFPLQWMSGEYDTSELRWSPILLIGACLGAAILASFAHLGTKKNAWRVLAHLSHSWLSREILFTGLFGLGWLFTSLESVIWHRDSVIGLGVTATLGLGLVYSMAQVYRLKAAPLWNSWRTNAGFIVSALLLGQSLMTSLWVFESNSTGIHISSIQRTIAESGMLILLPIQLLLIQKQFLRSLSQNIRIGLILIGIVLTVVDFLRSGSDVLWITILIFLVILLEEGVGRWLFYQSRT